jgi:hypothetical protein
MNFNLSCLVLINVEMDNLTFDFLFRFYLDSMYRHEAEREGFMFANQKLSLAGSSTLPFTLDQLRQAIRVLQDCYPGADGAARIVALKDDLQNAFDSGKEAGNNINNSLVLIEFGIMHQT